MGVRSSFQGFPHQAVGLVHPLGNRHRRQAEHSGDFLVVQPLVILQQDDLAALQRQFQDCVHQVNVGFIRGQDGARQFRGDLQAPVPEPCRPADILAGVDDDPCQPRLLGRRPAEGIKAGIGLEKAFLLPFRAVGIIYYFVIFIKFPVPGNGKRPAAPAAGQGNGIPLLFPHAVRLDFDLPGTVRETAGDIDSCFQSLLVEGFTRAPVGIFDPAFCSVFIGSPFDHGYLF